MATFWNMARKIASLILSEDGENSADDHKTHTNRGFKIAGCQLK
jgi:hypothetical protein